MDQPQSNPTETLSEFIVVRRSDFDAASSSLVCPLQIIAPAAIIEDEEGRLWETCIFTHLTQRDKKLSDLVAALFNRTLSIADDDLTPGECKQHAALLHSVGKIASESGELIDAVWAMWTYKRPLDRDNVLEECGDLLFYIEATLATLGMTMEQARQSLYKKLAKRYPNGYSNAAANARADKQQDGSGLGKSFASAMLRASEPDRPMCLQDHKHPGT
jgi:NTP pyrophosphatase (non-canonical NTP hydrolase)